MSDVKGFFQRAAIPTPDLTVEGLHATAVALKEAVDVFMGQRGVPEESVVFKRDLILTGILTNPVYPFTVPPRDNYVPGLSFGGLDTGMAYLKPPAGRWFRLGSLVFFTVGIQLSAKGTATGQAGFSLPYMSRPTENGYFIIDVRLFNTVGGVSNAVGLIEPGMDQCFLWQSGGSTAPVAITSADCSNTLDLIASGFYEAYVETTQPETLLQTQHRP
jgi:hypothetical protein